MKILLIGPVELWFTGEKLGVLLGVEIETGRNVLIPATHYMAQPPAGVPNITSDVSTVTCPERLDGIVEDLVDAGQSGRAFELLMRKP